ncbi:MAG: chromate transporter [Clostridia bacterium]|nr:chromate transporter [Clostridia bacterium]
MMYLELFAGFLKVGCFSFGGAYAAIPIIRDVVFSYGWLNDEMLSYMIAVSESTPGPLMVNLATYIGSSQGGFPGALLATFAVIFPAFLIMLIVAALMSRVSGNKYAEAAMQGIIPCVTGMIFATGCRMIAGNIFTSSFGINDIRFVIITVLLAVLYFCPAAAVKKRISPVILILISGILGIIMFGI